MPTNRLLLRALAYANGCALAVAVCLWLAGRGSTALALGFALGLVCASLGLWLFFCAWRAAPDGGAVALFYTLRLAIVFGSVIAAMFWPAVDALGAVVPQLFSIPVLAVLLALHKEE